MDYPVSGHAPDTAQATVPHYVDANGNAVAFAAGSVPSGDTPKGYQQITSLAAAQPLTVPAGARWALIRAESQAVRWRDDGTNPTATVGVELLVGEGLAYTGNLATIKFIEEAASAKLDISYYG